MFGGGGGDCGAAAAADVVRIVFLDVIRIIRQHRVEWGRHCSRKPGPYFIERSAFSTKQCPFSISRAWLVWNGRIAADLITVVDNIIMIFLPNKDRMVPRDNERSLSRRFPNEN